jgi:hypothetical protein
MRRLLWISLLVPLLGCGTLSPNRPLRNGESARADSGGTADAAAEEVDPQKLEILVDEPNQEQPVASGFALSRSTVSPGETTTLVIRCRTVEPWYIYAVEGPTGVAAPTTLELSLPPIVSLASNWSLPPAHTKHSPLGNIAVYAGDFRFSVPLSVAEEAEVGRVEFPCVLRYQACSDRSCLPPTEIRLSVPITIAAE